MQSAREYLIALCLDYQDNYITRAKFAEHHGLTLDECIALLDLSYRVSSHPHPES